MHYLRHLVGGLVVCLVSAPAFAVPINGELGITGFLTPYCTATASTCTMDIANALDFGGNGFGTDGPFLVSFASGDFDTAGIGFGDVGTITDFQFDPLAPDPVSPLWSLAGFSFDLESVTIVDQTSMFLLLRGSGTISAGGFDDTMGVWSLSADNSTGDVSFSWSSTTAAPEPGIVLLLGLGLIGLLTARRLA